MRVADCREVHGLTVCEIRNQDRRWSECVKLLRRSQRVIADDIYRKRVRAIAGRDRACGRCSREIDGDTAERQSAYTDLSRE